MFVNKLNKDSVVTHSIGSIFNTVFLYIRKQVQSTRIEAEKDGVTIPMTLEDYCVKTKVRPQDESLDMTDFYVDDFDDSDDCDDSDIEDTEENDKDDSGNEES